MTLDERVEEDLFPAHPPALIENKAMDELQSKLTDAFETSLYEGMKPMDALSVILAWVSSEIVRIDPNHARGA